MPDATTLPSTFSARKAVLLNRAKGNSTKPASVTSLNSIRVTKSCTDRMKKAMRMITQATSSTAIWMKLAKRSEEHTSELQSLMRISSAVFCLKKKKTKH